MSSIDNAQRASGMFTGEVIASAWAPTRRQLAAQSHAVLAASVAAGAEEIARLKRICLALTTTAIGTIAALRANNLYGPADVLEKALEAARATK